jgi:hypothetical protein
MKAKFFSMMALAAALVMGFTACDDKNDGKFNNADLVGTWDFTAVYARMTVNGEFVDDVTLTGDEAKDEFGLDYLVVKADGTGDSFLFDGEVDPFTWDLSGETLSITFDADEVEEYHLESLTSSKMVISMTNIDDYDSENIEEEYTRLTFEKR